jgi:CRISPR-associated protein Csx14
MSDTGIMGLTKENFNSYKSKIADILKQGFGLGALPEIAIDTVGVRPDTCYGIKMDRDRIRVIF